MCETRLYHVPLAFQSVYGCCNERCENFDVKDGIEISRGERLWRFPSLLYADDLVLCSESEDLKMMVGRFIGVCKSIGLKANADKS